MQLEGLQIGSYRLVRLIGGGGMGDVYLAEDLRVNRQVAIKVIQTRPTSYIDNGTTPDTIRLFQREVKAIANLDHPHILPFFDCGAGNINGIDITYMVMPFRREGSLLAWLRQHSPSKALAPQYVAQLLRQAAEALQYAHDQQIIHRDVKPSNFLIRSSKEHPDAPDLLLADFGLAKFSTVTAAVSHANYGTPIYMAPEHWDGKPVPATDQYALAVMAYELLTGRPPFLGNQQQVMYQHLEVQPQPPSKHNPRVPASIDAVILRALAKRPADRYSSISAFAHAFEQALQGTDPPEREPQPTQSTEYAYSTRGNGRTSTSIAIPIPASDTLTAKQGRTLSTSRVMFLIGFIGLVFILGGGMFAYANIHPNIQSHANASVTAQATARVTVQAATGTGTVSPSQDPYSPYKGTLAFSDPLHDNSNGYNWDEVTDSQGSCTFTAGAYHATATEPRSFHACTKATNFSNFAYQVQMTIVAGDYGGILFRVDDTHAKFYCFRIGKDSSYELSLHTSSTRSGVQILKSGFSPAIKTGLNQVNVIGVVASGSGLDLYVNDQEIADVGDSTLSQGQLGVFAEATSTSTQVVYSDARVWRL